MSQCSSFWNMEVDFISQSDTMDSGTPWSLTISIKKSHATSLAVTHVVVGIRCICDVKRLIMTSQ